MATYASTVAQNENLCALRGKGIGGATADLPKPEKKDCKDMKALADLPKPAKHLESEEVEASSLKRKSSQEGTKTTKKARTSNILTDEETKKCFEWEGEEIEEDHDHEICAEVLDHDHPMCIELLKEESEDEDEDPELWDWSWFYVDSATPAEKIEPEIEILPRRLEPEIIPPFCWPTVSPTSAEWLLGVVRDLKLSHPPPIATVPLGARNDLPYSFGWRRQGFVDLYNIVGCIRLKEEHGSR